MNIAENTAQVLANITAAALRANRDPSEARLIGVTKTVGVDQIKELLRTGVNLLGENRPQELSAKHGAVSSGFKEVEWHLIGHLQTNKVKMIIDKAAMIHSVDSIRLTEEINRRAGEAGRVTDILIEINIAGEDSKHGVSLNNYNEFFKILLDGKFQYVRPRGLMCVAPYVENPENNRCYFRKMREILFDINSKLVHNRSLTELSMGMTNDYETAVEEGATFVRVGTGIFGARRD